jgi:toxin ParE1/3/4
MRIRLTSRARADIEENWQYLNSRSPSGARNVVAAIDYALTFIADHPYATERTDNPNFRSAVVGRYPYRIFYSIVEDTVEILHIRHTSRRPWQPQ